MIIDKLRNMKNFTDVEKEIAEFIISESETVLKLNVDELAILTYTSAPSIIRFCKKIGFKGFSEFKIQLAMEIDSFILNGNKIEVDMPIKKDSSKEDIAKTFLNLHHQVLTNVYHNLDLASIERCAKKICQANSVSLRGLGPSLLLVADFHYKLKKLGVPCELSSLAGFDLLIGQANDKDNICLIVSTYAVSNDIRRIMLQCKDNDFKIILITCNDQSPLLKLADDLIVVDNVEEDRMKKMGSFASRMALTYVLDILYSLIFKENFEENMKAIADKDTKIKNSILSNS
ncbi:MAG: MurR/RpiR family transcriptional regulator [Erysipelotrichaceae bacterium]|nr:MurR/RpiR family transcriptional regulator [Erysipelotrichaceae bacterium]MDY5251667.1 MurR/RpiR family transcriptional regulator [Erysipelotrichaceae bacterium]